MHWGSDEELFDTIRRDLFTAVVGDVMDTMGLLRQFLPPQIRPLDDLKAEEVYICTGASPRYALWGELMSTRAINLGAAGAVVDGYHRDTSGILQLGFPTFSYGGYAQDQAPRGKVIDFRVPLEIGGVRVMP